MSRIVLLLLLGLLAMPAEARDANKGRQLAKTLCSRCHAIGPVGASPHPQAPPFRVIARRYKPESLEEALAEGIVVGHRDMPEFELTTGDIDDFIAYLNRLRRR
ncbi:MAG: cytochrome c [Methylobacterium sp.]|nr:cytochrome c [Methylobacterium sp.]